MISKNKLKFYMCIPIYGTLACLRILQTEYELYRRITYKKLLRATFFSWITLLITTAVAMFGIGHIMLLIWHDRNLLIFAGLIALLLGGIAMNLVFYKYYKKNFANNEQDSNDKNNDTQK